MGDSTAVLESSYDKLYGHLATFLVGHRRGDGCFWRTRSGMAFGYAIKAGVLAKIRI
jgi:hypothetical protein